MYSPPRREAGPKGPALQIPDGQVENVNVAGVCRAARLRVWTRGEHGARGTSTGEAYRADVEQFRHALEAKLTSDTGWLTIAGLSFLTKPETTFGSAPGNDIVLPGATPARVGTFVLAKDGRISVRLEPGLQVHLLDGRPFAGGAIKTDGDGPPDRLVLGDVQVWVHKSGDRACDPHPRQEQSAAEDVRRDEVVPDRRVLSRRGDVRAVRAPKHVAGSQPARRCGHDDGAGRSQLRPGGQAQRMLAVEDGEELWFIFRDLTSGDTTYQAARFLYTPLPEDGKVVLDFNRAENPPCAYNPFTTCPLPPPQNRLKVASRPASSFLSDTDRWLKTSSLKCAIPRNAECRMPSDANAERRMPNAECRTPNRGAWAWG